MHEPSLTLILIGGVRAQKLEARESQREVMMSKKKSMTTNSALETSLWRFHCPPSSCWSRWTRLSTSSYPTSQCGKIGKWCYQQWMQGTWVRQMERFIMVRCRRCYVGEMVDVKWMKWPQWLWSCLDWAAHDGEYGFNYKRTDFHHKQTVNSKQRCFES